MSAENVNGAPDKDENVGILAQAFLKNHISVVKLNLQTGEALVVKSELDREATDAVYAWSDLVGRFADRRVYPPDRELVLSLTLEKVREFCLTGEGDFPIRLRCRSGELGFEWAELNAALAGPDGNTALITTRDVSEAVLIQRIVELFVYRNYDYLLLIDSKKDSYVRFTDNNGRVPVPDEKGDHYTEDMIRFNRLYVAEEECERVTANMQLAHVIRMLEDTDIYSFTSGGVTKDGRYRRSRVVFLYYDKAAGLILAARNDVTQIYLEEQEKSRRLAEALRRAQHDALTGIYNQKATAELVKRSLESRYRSAAAVFFIDVDNFKMVNDTLGHQKGDELLCYLARKLREIAGHNGIAGRIGGDEFLVYLSDLVSVEEAGQTARQICGIFDGFSDVSLLQDMISCSVGISVYPRDGTDYDMLLRKADQALYTSKRYGKNKYFFYSCEESGGCARNHGRPGG